MDPSSPMEGFTVQKWMRDRELPVAPRAPALVNTDRRNELQLIFNYLDSRRRGKISHEKIRTALGMVQLSEDPVRHTNLAENIVSFFQSPGDSKRLRPTIDFNQFKTVMSSQEEGQTFPTLQEELKSNNRAVATANFADLFRKEVVVRGMLDRGGTDMCMCSIFKGLFKTAGLTESTGVRAQKLMLLEMSLQKKKAKALESKRAALARQTLVERSGRPYQNNGWHSITRASALLAALLNCKLPEERASDESSEDNCSAESGLDPQHETAGKKRIDSNLSVEPSAANYSVWGKKRRSGLPQKNATGSSCTEDSSRLRQEASREASAMIGLHYTPRPPPTTPTARILNAFRFHPWRRGENSDVYDRSTGDMTINSVLGGFVRHPPPRVRRLRQCSLEDFIPKIGAKEASAEAGGGLGVHTVGSVASDMNAKLNPPPLCSRRDLTRLPSWALCDRSSKDPAPLLGRQRTVKEKRRECAQGVMGSPELCTTATLTTAIDQATPCTRKRGASVGLGVGGKGDRETASRPAKQVGSPLSAAPHTTKNTTTSAVEDAISEKIQEADMSNKNRPFSSIHPYRSAKQMHRSSEQRRQGDWKTIFPKETRPLLRQPEAPRNGRGRGRGMAGFAVAKVPPPTPWRSPRLVRCMRRPEPARYRRDET